MISDADDDVCSQPTPKHTSCQHMHEHQQAAFSAIKICSNCAGLNTKTSVWQVVMYDEPTAGLDPVASTVVEDLIRSLQSTRGQQTSREGISSYIVVTHQHSTIRRAVDRLVFLHEVC